MNRQWQSFFKKKFYTLSLHRPESFKISKNNNIYNQDKKKYDKSIKRQFLSEIVLSFTFAGSSDTAKMSEEIIVSGPEIDFEVKKESFGKQLIQRLKSHPKNNVIQVSN